MNNYALFVLNSALSDLYRNKGRTLLTSLGILIGVLSVVLLIAFGLGLKLYIKNQFDSLGTNLLRVLPGSVIRNGSFRNSPGTASIKFEEKDLTVLRRLKDVQYVMPVVTKSATVFAGKNKDFTDIYMSSADLFLGLNLKVQKGAAFTKTQVDNRSKAVVLGPKLAEKLFGTSKEADIFLTVSEVLAHLDLLIEGQNARAETRDGLIYYSAA